MVIRGLKASCLQVYVTVGVQNKDQIQDGNLGFSQTLIKLPISGEVHWTSSTWKYDKETNGSFTRC